MYDNHMVLDSYDYHDSHVNLGLETYDNLVSVTNMILMRGTFCCVLPTNQANFQHMNYMYMALTQQILSNKNNSNNLKQKLWASNFIPHLCHQFQQ